MCRERLMEKSGMHEAKAKKYNLFDCTIAFEFGCPYSCIDVSLSPFVVVVIYSCMNTFLLKCT